jgi:mxaJ protein
MSSVSEQRRRSSVALFALLALGSHTVSNVSANAASSVAAGRALRVCADPNNLPFSNQREQGFENALARLAAKALGQTLEYTWWPQRRGFIRNTLDAGRCDVVMGLPAGFELALTTAPYYRSSYVFVTRLGRALRVKSFDDPALKALRIGVHVIGDDYQNVPPVAALAARGVVNNVRGFSIYGDYSQPDPPRALIDAVAHSEIDVAVAWGPLAGYFAGREPIKLSVTPVAPQNQGPRLQMAFDIAMGVRRGDLGLQRALDTVLVEHTREVHALLVRFGVPLLESPRVANPSHQE